MRDYTEDLLKAKPRDEINRIEHAPGAPGREREVMAPEIKLTVVVKTLKGFKREEDIILKVKEFVEEKAAK